MPVSRKQRGAAGVICSVSAVAEGGVRVTMDDVELAPTGEEPSWNHKAFVMFKDYPGGIPEVDALTDVQFAAFGRFFLARLFACHSQYGSKIPQGN